MISYKTLFILLNIFDFIFTINLNANYQIVLNYMLIITSGLILITGNKNYYYFYVFLEVVNTLIIIGSYGEIDMVIIIILVCLFPRFSIIGYLANEL